MDALEEPYNLFVSYADRDRRWAEGYLLDCLRSAGVRCLTQGEFRLGAIWTEEFERAVAQSDRVVLVLSAAYRTDVNQRFLDQLARYYELENETESVIPLLLDGMSPPLGIKAKVCLPATTDEEKAAAVERLVRECQAGPPPKDPEPKCPYPGMAAFDEKNADWFRGRTQEVDALLQELRHRRCLFLIGGSGSGKSSLVLAGLVPRLQEGRTVLVMRPGATPATAFAQKTTGTLGGRHLLVVDQFEEVYTQATDPEASQFLESLCAWVDVPEHILIVTVRSDYYKQVQDSPIIFPMFQANRRDVLPLGREGMREAIVQPAESVGVFVEPALVEMLLADAAREKGVLPHLQETLQLLWAKRRRRYLPLEAYQELGRDGRTGLQVAMTVVADAAIDGLVPQCQAVARRIFLRLVQFGQGREDTRRQLAESDLKTTGAAPELLEQTLQHLARHRLLTLGGEEKQGGRTVDMAHEALISGWPTLRQWVEERREAEPTRRRLEDKAKEWVRLGRGKGGLLDEIALLEAERWLESAVAADLGRDEILTALVRASRQAIEQVEREKAAQRKRDLEQAQQLAAAQKRELEQAKQVEQEQQRANRLLWKGIGFAVLLAAVALIVAGIALHFKNAADATLDNLKNKEQQAASQRLALLAKRYLDSGKLDHALLLSVEASNARDTAEASDALLSAVESSYGMLRCLKRLPGLKLGLQFTKGGKTGLLASRRSELLNSTRLSRFTWNLTFWDSSDSHFDGLRVASSVLVEAEPVSLDGNTLVLATYNPSTNEHAIIVWSLFRGEQAGAPIPLKAPVEYLAISRDGQRLAAASEDGLTAETTITCWDLPTRREIMRLPPCTWVLGGLAFSPGGRTLVEAHYTNEGKICVSRWDLESKRKIVDSQPLEEGESSLTTRTMDWQTLAVLEWENQRRRMSIRLWDFLDEQGIAALAASGASTVGLLAPPAGQCPFLAVSALIPARTGIAKPPVLPRHAPNTQMCCCVCPDAKVLVTAEDATISMWNLTTGKTIGQPISCRHPVRELAARADGKTIAAASSSSSDGSTITLWDFTIKEPKTTAIPVRGHLTGIALSPDGTALAAANGALVFVWKLPLRSVLEERLPLQGKATHLWLAPDGKALFTSSIHGEGTRFRHTIERWPFSSPFTKAAPLHTQNDAAAIAVSPAGNSVVVAGRGRQNLTDTIECWDLSPSARMDKSWPIKYCPFHMAIDPGRNTLWTAEHTDSFYGVLTFTEWDLSTKKRTAGLGPFFAPKLGSMGARFSPTCETAAIWNSGRDKHSVTLIQLSDPERKVVELGPFPGSAITMEFTPNGKTLALASCNQLDWESTIRFLEVPSGNALSKPLTLGGAVHVLAMSADGSFLAAASDSRTGEKTSITLWDIPSGESTGNLMPLPPDGQVRGLAFGEDGKVLAAHIGDAVLLWDLHRDTWIRRARDLANRPLTDEERTLFMIPEDSPRK
jgi:WD40 repeat protein